MGVRACIDNRQLQLRPGMFARVTAVFGERDRAKVVPEEAIVPQGAKQFVLKVVDGPDKDTKATQRVEVKVGIRRPGRVEIAEGLEEGDVVVVAGQQRVQRDGAPVRVLDIPSRGGQGGAGSGSGGSGPATGGAAAAPASVASAGAPVAAPAPAVVMVPKGRPSVASVQGPNPCLVTAADAAGAVGAPGAPGTTGTTGGPASARAGRPAKS